MTSARCDHRRSDIIIEDEVVRLNPVDFPGVETGQTPRRRQERQIRVETDQSMEIRTCCRQWPALAGFIMRQVAGFRREMRGGLRHDIMEFGVRSAVSTMVSGASTLFSTCIGWN